MASNRTPAILRLWFCVWFCLSAAGCTLFFDSSVNVDGEADGVADVASDGASDVDDGGGSTDAGETDADGASADAADGLDADARDGLDADSRDADDDGGDDADAEPGDRNACGGTASLMHDGEAAAPGDACGACGGGVLSCAGIDALACQGAALRNACGGCGPLPGAIGDSCGPCGDGVLQCDGEGGMVCEDAGIANACGGCDPLAARPGWSCLQAGGEPGWYQCEGENALVCATRNRCGGAPGSLDWEDAPAEPGDACQTACGDGVLVCDGLNRLRCESPAGDANACGGCTLLADDLEEQSCGACGGSWTCGDGGPVCQGGGTNACGGCDVLDASPGDPCEGGALACDGRDALVCVLDPAATNACGGTAELGAVPGEACSPCGRGTVVCDSPDTTTCVATRGSLELNACGGCDELSVEIGQLCGSCGSGVWACDPEDETGNGVFCEGALPDATVRNACGGCGTLGVSDGDACGLCAGTVSCSDRLDPVCAGDIESLDALNECDGCGVLEGEPGDTCGACAEQVWVCTDDGTVSCDTSVACDTCDNRERDGDETDVDCGGPDCDPCDVGDACVRDEDCPEDSSCVDDLCRPRGYLGCFNGERNGVETGVDCGGPVCPFSCTEICENGEQDGDEEGVDCGGTNCDACGTDPCDNGVLDEGEDAVDCGGSCPPCPPDGVDCTEIISRTPTAESGAYFLDLNGPEAGNPFDIYCDHDVDGGGWTLLVNIERSAGEEPTVAFSTNTAPILTGPVAGGLDERTGPTLGIDHTLWAGKPNPEFRFYGRSGAHERVVHFTTTDADCVAYIISGTGSCDAGFAYDALPGHDGVLPGGAVFAGSATDPNRRLLDNPFSSATALWSAGDNDIWAIDDLGITDADILLRVYVRACPDTAPWNGSRCAGGTPP